MCCVCVCVCVCVRKKSTKHKMAASQIVDGWFGEKEQMWPGQRFSLKVKGEVLYSAF